MVLYCPECGKETEETAVLCSECGQLLNGGKINPVAQYNIFYDLIVQETEYLRGFDASSEYKLCKALAACYELQEYLSNRLAEYGSDNRILINIAGDADTQMSTSPVSIGQRGITFRQPHTF